MKILVIGAGPAGLAAAACLRQEGLSFRLVDATGLVGGSYRRLYPRIQLSSPARWLSLPGLKLDAPGEYVTVQDYSEYLQRYAGHHGLEAERATVKSISRSSGKLTVRLNEDEASFEAVVVATGLDTPVWPNIPRAGDGPTFLHSRDWQGPTGMQRVLIVGRGTSAVEIAEESARAGLAPAVSARGGKVTVSPQRVLGRDVHDWIFPWSWLPLWLARSYCRTTPPFPGTDLGFTRHLRAGELSVVPEVARFEGHSAIFVDGTQRDFDTVVMATGYRWGMQFLPSEVARSVGDGHPMTRHGQSLSWPELYVIGTHCSNGVSSQFLRGMALDALALARLLRRQMNKS